MICYIDKKATFNLNFLVFQCNVWRPFKFIYTAFSHLMNNFKEVMEHFLFNQDVHFYWRLTPSDCPVGSAIQGKKLGQRWEVGIRNSPASCSV